MKRSWVSLCRFAAFLAVALAPNHGWAIPYPGGDLDLRQEQVYPQGASLDAVIADMTSNQKWNKVSQWMHARNFRRISGDLASHNQSSNGGATRTSMVPFKNDATHHGAIAVEVKGFDGTGHPIEGWLIWEFWKVGDAVDGNTYVMNANGFDPDTQMNRSFQQFAACVTQGCGTAAGGCFIGNIIDGETGFAPCYVSWCGGAIGFCAFCAIFCG